MDAPEDAVAEAVAEPLAAPEAAVDAAESAPEETAEARVSALVKAVFRALEPGDGRSSRCTVVELSERLEQDSVTFTPSDLDEVLMRLEDCGQIMRVQRQPGYPQFLLGKSRHPYDRTDALASGRVRFHQTSR